MSLPSANLLRVTGLSHHKAPVSLREKLAFRADDLPKALDNLLARGFNEAIILSTCNRVELYSVSSPSAELPEPAGRIVSFLSEYHSLPVEEFAPALYDLSGAEAIRHLFEVAASLDSQILGETEILSQSKEAYRVAAESGACGRTLRGIFERAFFLSKELRADGGIGRSQASVSSAAVQLAKKLFELKDRKVLVVGTGEMATGIVRALKSAGVAELWVASRSEARATEFAEREGGKPCRMQQIDEYLAKVDIVLVSTAAPHYILGPKEIQLAASKRRGRTLCLIDISVPRNVDPAVHEFEDTFLYDIDDLEEVAKDGRREREAVAARWRPKLAEEARELLHCLSDSEPRETAKRLLEQAAAIRSEIARESAKGLDPKAAEALERALERLQGRLLHGPLDTLKQASREGGGVDAAAWVSRLFRLQKTLTDADNHTPTEHVATKPKTCKDMDAPIESTKPASNTETGGGVVAIAGR